MAYFIMANLESRYLLLLVKKVLADLKSDRRTLDVALERNVKQNSLWNLKICDVDGHFLVFGKQ